MQARRGCIVAAAFVNPWGTEIDGQVRTGREGGRGQHRQQGSGRAGEQAGGPELEGWGTGGEQPPAPAFLTPPVARARGPALPPPPLAAPRCPCRSDPQAQPLPPACHSRRPPPHPLPPPPPQSLAAQLFAASLLPYLGFLYHLTRSGKAPRTVLFGFYFLLAFVGATIPAGIYAKQHYGTSLANVDWL